MVFSVTLILAASAIGAAELDVTVLDWHGRPVPDVAVYTLSDQDEPLPAPTAAAVMDQVNMQFSPKLLVVQTGTRVQFTNNDAVAHHIYSFSMPNNFVLPMFKGNMRPNVEFENPGIVTMGCNLHDDMLGYILVVDSPTFGKTGLDGRILLSADNPDGLTINIWSPRIRLESENLTQTVRAGRSAQITFSLTEELRAAQQNGMEASLWSED